MTFGLATTLDDLAEAYRTFEPDLVGHHQAEGVIAGAAGIAVLCCTNPDGEAEHTWLLELADADGAVRWERRYEPALGAGRAIAAAPGGGFVIGGDVRRGPLEYRASLLRVDAGGEVIAARALGPGGATGFGAVAVLDDGAIVAGGAAARAAGATAGPRGWLVRVDAALAAARELWIDDADDVAALAPRAGGALALAARRETSTTRFGLTRVAALAPDGSARWEVALPAAGRGEPAALAAGPGEALFAAGHAATTAGEPAHLWAACLDGTGVIAWERGVGRAGEERRCRAAAALADGGVAIAGDARLGAGRGVRLARLSPRGEVRWERDLGGEGHDTARSLAVTADGGLVLVGSTTARGPGRTNPWVVRLDGEGRVVWDRVLAAGPGRAAAPVA